MDGIAVKRNDSGEDAEMKPGLKQVEAGLKRVEAGRSRELKP
jgi:hypothetical protein